MGKKSFTYHSSSALYVELIYTVPQSACPACPLCLPQIHLTPLEHLSTYLTNLELTPTDHHSCLELKWLSGHSQYECLLPILGAHPPLIKRYQAGDSGKSGKAQLGSLRCWLQTSLQAYQEQVLFR